MAFFMLAGRPDCKHFVHCLYIANYLDKHLPHFNYRTIQFDRDRWEHWLLKVNEQNGWFHATSPLIWKEIHCRGGKPHLIGGISDFWEYVYDYYGLQSILSQETLDNLIKSNMALYNATSEIAESKHTRTRNIIIYGAADPMVPILLPGLNDIVGLNLQMGIRLMLFQPDMTSEQEEYLEGLIEDYRTINHNIELLRLIDEGICICDLLIYTDTTAVSEEVDFDRFMIQNVFKMTELAYTITATSRRGIRIVVANGPVCFNANMLLYKSNMLRTGNIVAVTADQGSPYLNTISTHLQLPLDSLGAPPVWGSVGLECYVDVGATVQRCHVYRPHARALRVGATSTLALGTMRTELRTLSYLTDEVDIEAMVKQREMVYKSKFGGPQVLPKVTAIINLLKLWYADADNSGEIISLGVGSDGSFDLPLGLYFSQPVMLQEGVWKPVGNFPITQRTKNKIAALVPQSLGKVEQYFR